MLWQLRRGLIPQVAALSGGGGGGGGGGATARSAVLLAPGGPVAVNTSTTQRDADAGNIMINSR